MTNYYKTKNIYLGAVILANTLGELIDVNRSNARHIEFMFRDETGMTDFERLERDFSNKLVSVNATEYADAIRRLKAIIHKDE